jgi:hypothetical protein
MGLFESASFWGDLILDGSCDLITTENCLANRHSLFFMILQAQGPTAPWSTPAATAQLQQLLYHEGRCGHWRRPICAHTHYRRADLLQIIFENCHTPASLGDRPLGDGISHHRYKCKLISVLQSSSSLLRDNPVRGVPLACTGRRIRN